jgi:putative addiction module killer protein
MKRIEIFQTVEGNEPFTDWLESLGNVAQSKILAYIDRVSLGGSKKNVKSLGNKLFEIKVDTGPGYHVYFGELGDTIMLLLGGGDKGSQSSDIKLAKKHWRLIDV